jgi:hypothetical protein
MKVIKACCEIAAVLEGAFATADAPGAGTDASIAANTSTGQHSSTGGILQAATPPAAAEGGD